MTFITADRVKENTQVTGTGDIGLLGSAKGHQAFSDVLSDGDTCPYSIVDRASGDYEVGIATYNSAADSLTRTTVKTSSNAGSKVDFSAGMKTVGMSPPSDRVPVANSDPSPGDVLRYGTEWTHLPDTEHGKLHKVVEGTVNAGHPDFTGANNAEKVDAAIQFANTNNHPLCLVPDSLIPYEPTAMPNGHLDAVRMVREGQQVSGWFDPIAYGAAVDGSTDDHPAWQACVDALPSDGGVIWVPRGDSAISKAILYRGKRVAFRGGGWSHRIVLQSPFSTDNADGDLWGIDRKDSVADTDSVSFFNFAMVGVGNAIADPAAIHMAGIAEKGGICRGVQADTFGEGGAGSGAIDPSVADGRYVISECEFLKCSKAVGLTNQDNQACRVVNNYAFGDKANNNGQAIGFVADNGDDHYLGGNTAEDCAIGHHLSTAQNSVLSAPVAVECDIGIKLEGAAQSQATDVQVRRCTKNGVWIVQGSTDCRVTGHVYENGTDTTATDAERAGVLIANDCHRADVDVKAYDEQATPTQTRPVQVNGDDCDIRVRNSHGHTVQDTIRDNGSGNIRNGVEPVVTFSDGDSSPDVSGGAVFNTANTGATTINEFEYPGDLPPPSGKRITVIVEDGNTTFAHHAGGQDLDLDGNANFSASNRDRIEFVFDDGRWWEVSRITT